MTDPTDPDLVFDLDAVRVAAASTAEPGERDAALERVRSMEDRAAEHQRAIVELATEYNRRDAVTAALRAERDELAATLANERGEGAGPSEGWAFQRDGWRTPSCSALPYTPKPRNALRMWAWTCMPLVGECITGTAPTAREAMRAADLARGVK
jgi:hypothetical protein